MRFSNSRHLLAFAGALGLSAAAIDLARDAEWALKRKSFWSFQRPVKSPVPGPGGRNPIDAFIEEKLREKKIAPAPQIGQTALLRRLTLDLTGLPPTPGEVDQFLTDSRPGAYERVADRLLASPHYGERWAQRWLDVVRYADSNGFELDEERPHAWRYRDYVVRSFNQDKPYARFVQEQLAGDELFPGNEDALVATGFHRAGPIHLVGGNQDEEMNRQEVLTEMSATVSSAFLGLTVGCARCHNHKFDPIPQTDYYRLQAVLASTEYKDVPLGTTAEREAAEAARKAHEARLKPILDAIKAIEKPYRDRIIAERREKLDSPFKAALAKPREQRTDEEKRLAKEAMDQISPTWDEVLAIIPDEERGKRKTLRQQLHALNLHAPDPPPHAYAVAPSEKAPETQVLKVGDHRHKLGAVPPGFLAVLAPDAHVPASISGRRSALAKWLTAPDHPLLARVMVNRIWQFRMGTGLVATPNDFGAMGSRPSNQKLLDWLAVEFLEHGGSVKHLDRLIVTSNAYRRGVSYTASSAAIDPENKYYWRANRRRLEAEAIRDSALAAAGILNPRLGGKPVRIPIEQEVYDIIFTEAEPDNLWPVDPDPENLRRRSLYLLKKRTVALPFMANFDQPDMMTSCALRPASTHALQALSMMNSDMMAGLAKDFAATLERECGANEDCRVRRAYKRALARLPAPDEVVQARTFLRNGGHWHEFTLALLNRNEFVYLP